MAKVIVDDFTLSGLPEAFSALQVKLELPRISDQTASTLWITIEPVSLSLAASKGSQRTTGTNSVPWNLGHTLPPLIVGSNQLPQSTSALLQSQLPNANANEIGVLNVFVYAKSSGFLSTKNPELVATGTSQRLDDLVASRSADGIQFRGVLTVELTNKRVQKSSLFGSKSNVGKSGDSPFIISLSIEVIKAVGDQQDQSGRDSVTAGRPLSVTRSKDLNRRFIRIFNSDQDAVYLDLDSGRAGWILPTNVHMHCVTFMAHLSDGGPRVYFEDLKSKSVAWTPPMDEMSSLARAAYGRLSAANRSDTEREIGKPYDEGLSLSQFEALDVYLAKIEADPDADFNAIADSIIQPDEEFYLDPDDSISGNSNLTDINSGATQSDGTSLVANAPVASIPPATPMVSAFRKCRIMHIITKDELDAYLDMKSGETYWTLPPCAHLASVAFMSHTSDDGSRVYFEDLRSKSVAWTPPYDKMSTLARAAYDRLSLANRSDSEREIGMPYDEKLSIDQFERLDAFIAAEEASPSGMYAEYLDDSNEDPMDKGESPVLAIERQTRVPFQVDNAVHIQHSDGVQHVKQIAAANKVPPVTSMSTSPLLPRSDIQAAPPTAQLQVAAHQQLPIQSIPPTISSLPAPKPPPQSIASALQPATAQPTLTLPAASPQHLQPSTSALPPRPPPPPVAPSNSSINAPISKPQPPSPPMAPPRPPPPPPSLGFASAAPAPVSAPTNASTAFSAGPPADAGLPPKPTPPPAIPSSSSTAPSPPIPVVVPYLHSNPAPQPSPGSGFGLPPRPPPPPKSSSADAAALSAPVIIPIPVTATDQGTAIAISPTASAPGPQLGLGLPPRPPPPTKSPSAVVSMSSTPVAIPVSEHSPAPAIIEPPASVTLPPPLPAPPSAPPVLQQKSEVEIQSVQRSPESNAPPPPPRKFEPETSVSQCSRCEDAEGLCERLRLEASAIQRTLDNLRKDFAESIALNANDKSTILSLEAQLKDLKDTTPSPLTHVALQESEDRAAKARQEFAKTFEEQASSHKDELTALYAQLRVAEARHSTAEATVKTKDDALKRLLTETESLRSQLKITEANLGATRSELDALESRSLTMNSDLSEKMLEASRMSVRCQQLEKQIQEMKSATSANSTLSKPQVVGERRATAQLTQQPTIPNNPTSFSASLWVQASTRDGLLAFVDVISGLCKWSLEDIVDSASINDAAKSHVEFQAKYSEEAGQVLFERLADGWVSWDLPSCSKDASDQPVSSKIINIVVPLLQRLHKPECQMFFEAQAALLAQLRGVSVTEWDKLLASLQRVTERANSATVASQQATVAQSTAIASTSNGPKEIPAMAVISTQTDISAADIALLMTRMSDIPSSSLNSRVIQSTSPSHEPSPNLISLVQLTGGNNQDANNPEIARLQGALVSTQRELTLTKEALVGAVDRSKTLEHDLRNLQTHSASTEAAGSGSSITGTASRRNSLFSRRQKVPSTQSQLPDDFMLLDTSLNSQLATPSEDHQSIAKLAEALMRCAELEQALNEARQQVAVPRIDSTNCSVDGDKESNSIADITTVEFSFTNKFFGNSTQRFPLELTAKDYQRRVLDIFVLASRDTILSLWQQLYLSASIEQLAPMRSLRSSFPPTQAASSAPWTAYGQPPNADACDAQCLLNFLLATRVTDPTTQKRALAVIAERYPRLYAGKSRSLLQLKALLAMWTTPSPETGRLSPADSTEGRPVEQLLKAVRNVLNALLEGGGSNRKLPAPQHSGDAQIEIGLQVLSDVEQQWRDHGTSKDRRLSMLNISWEQSNIQMIESSNESKAEFSQSQVISVSSTNRSMTSPVALSRALRSSLIQLDGLKAKLSAAVLSPQEAIPTQLIVRLFDFARLLAYCLRSNLCQTPTLGSLARQPGIATLSDSSVPIALSLQVRLRMELDESSPFGIFDNGVPNEEERISLLQQALIDTILFLEDEDRNVGQRTGSNPSNRLEGKSAAPRVQLNIDNLENECNRLRKLRRLLQQADEALALLHSLEQNEGCAEDDAASLRRAYTDFSDLRRQLKQLITPVDILSFSPLLQDRLHMSGTASAITANWVMRRPFLGTSVASLMILAGSPQLLSHIYKTWPGLTVKAGNRNSGSPSTRGFSDNDAKRIRAMAAKQNETDRAQFDWDLWALGRGASTPSFQDEVSSANLVDQVASVDFQSSSSLRLIGFALLDLLLSKKFKLSEILSAQYPVQDLALLPPDDAFNSSGPIPAQFRQSISVKAARLAGYGLRECKALNFSAAQLRGGGFDDAEIIETGGLSAAELRVAGLDMQKYALQTLFSATNGKHWKKRTNWNSGRPLGEWFGVHMNGAGLIDRIDLRSNALRGQLPDIFALLPGLKYLDLNNNELSGPLPPSLERSSCPLHDLWLSNNHGLGANSSTRAQLAAALPGCLIRL